MFGTTKKPKRPVWAKDGRVCVITNNNRRMTLIPEEAHRTVAAGNAQIAPDDEGGRELLAEWLRVNPQAVPKVDPLREKLQGFERAAQTAQAAFKEAEKRRDGLLALRRRAAERGEDIQREARRQGLLPEHERTLPDSRRSWTDEDDAALEQAEAECVRAARDVEKAIEAFDGNVEALIRDELAPRLLQEADEFYRQLRKIGKRFSTEISPAAQRFEAMGSSQDVLDAALTARKRLHNDRSFRRDDSDQRQALRSHIRSHEKKIDSDTALGYALWRTFVWTGFDAGKAFDDSGIIGTSPIRLDEFFRLKQKQRPITATVRPAMFG